MAVAMLAVMTIAGPLVSPANAQSRQEASQRLLAKGLATSDRKDALFLLERALVADPANAAALGALGSLYRDMDKPVLARKYFRNALTVDPTNTLALIGAARLEMADGKTEQASQRLKTLQVVCPACRETRELEAELSPR
tara:strand:- start:37448 stop:37867 length:420 start_codon:yes stop_codon:yes gene_type:complete